MAIDILEPADRNKLQRAVKHSYEQASSDRVLRNALIDTYNDARRYGKEGDAFVNYFQMFVRGHVLALGYKCPRFAVKSRTINGRGFDARIQNFLNRYFEVLGFSEILRQFAADSCFGDAIAKTIEGPPPVGVSSPLAPRVYRVNPNDFIWESSAESIDRSSFFADMYMVPYKEAVEYFQNERIQPYSQTFTEANRTRDTTDDANAQEVTRLIDVYIPAKGIVATYPCPNDSFGDLVLEPIHVTPTTVNPYSVCKLVPRVDSATPIPRLAALRPSHMLANRLWNKMARQAVQYKRHPIADSGDTEDLKHLLDAPDGEAVFVSDITKPPAIYAFPGADPSTMQTGAFAAQQFSEQAGNLNVMLGVNPGAGTARQTQALLGQIGSVQDYDRGVFEAFVADIAKKVATLAFASETLELHTNSPIPGTRIVYPTDWAPASQLPRMGTVDDFHFEVTPFSTAYRSPQERLTQLQDATARIAQIMSIAQMGAPINLEAVMASFNEAYDLLNLDEWWSGEPPNPAVEAGKVYTSTAAPAQGTNINYNSNAGGGADQLPLNAPPTSGVFGGM